MSQLDLAPLPQLRTPDTEAITDIAHPTASCRSLQDIVFNCNFSDSHPWGTVCLYENEHKCIFVKRKRNKERRLMAIYSRSIAFL